MRSLPQHYVNTKDMTDDEWWEFVRDGELRLTLAEEPESDWWPFTSGQTALYTMFVVFIFGTALGMLIATAGMGGQ